MLAAIRQWVIKTMTKGQTGVVTTMPKQQIIEMNTQITAERIMRNGINPEDLKTVGQVENVINQIDTPKVISADSAEGRGITEQFLGKKKAPVFDMEGNKIPDGAKIMGGKQVESDAVIKARLDADNKKGIKSIKINLVDDSIAKIKSMEPIEAMKEANLVAGKKGRYANLDDNQVKKIMDDTEDHIFERDIPDEDFATGGRVGFFMGGANTAGKSVLREMLKFFGKKSDSVKNPSDILKIVNPKQFNRMLEDPRIYGKFDVEKGIAAPDLIKDMQKKMMSDRQSTVKEMLGSAKNIKKSDDTTLRYKNEMIEELMAKGADRKMAEEMAETISKMAENAAGKSNTPKLTDEGILQLENILKNMETGGKKPRDLNADGGRISRGGGGTMGASDKGYQGGGRDKKGNVSGTAPGAAPGPGGNNNDDGPKGPPTVINPPPKNNKPPITFNEVTGKKMTAADRVTKQKFIDFLNSKKVYNSGENEEADNLYNEYRKATGLDDFQTNALVNSTTNQLVNQIDGDTKTFYDRNSTITDLDTGKSTKQLMVETPTSFTRRVVRPSGIMENDIPQPFGDPQSLFVDPMNMADGGRIGYKAGGVDKMRRLFLQAIGAGTAGIGAAKSGIFSFGKGAGKTVAKEVAQQTTSSMPPPYFFKLAEKIKMMGDDATATTDRTIAKTLKSKDGKSTYLLEEDVTTGDTIIKKINKEGDEMITDIEIMELKKGEVVMGKDGKPIKVPDEYEEVTEANARIEGDVFNDPYYTDGIEVDDIIKEVDDKVPSIKYASGGLAYMLGE